MKNFLIAYSAVVLWALLYRRRVGPLRLAMPAASAKTSTGKQRAAMGRKRPQVDQDRPSCRSPQQVHEVDNCPWKITKLATTTINGVPSKTAVIVPNWIFAWFYGYSTGWPRVQSKTLTSWFSAAASQISAKLKPICSHLRLTAYLFMLSWIIKNQYILVFSNQLSMNKLWTAKPNELKCLPNVSICAVFSSI